MDNIWLKLANNKKPFSILAPMEDVTDTVFRQLIASIAPPDLFFTEFTNCEGLMSDGHDKVAQRLLYSKKDKPLIAQVWGITPEDYYKSAKYIASLGFDGLDINMGCPVRNVIKQGACSALIKNPELAKEIVQAAKEGLQNKIPLSIKTRIGFNEIQTTMWVGFLLENCQPDALTVHLRTVKDLSKVPNRFEEMKVVSDLRNNLGLKNKTVLIINGDINSAIQGQELAKKYDIEGYMIGRGVFQNPWIFNPDIDPASFDMVQRLEILKTHTLLYQKYWQDKKPINNLKKYIKIYINDWPNSAKYRQQLMESENYLELLSKIDDLLGLFLNR